MKTSTRRVVGFLQRHPRAAWTTRLGAAVISAQSTERISLSAAAVAFWAALGITPAFIAIAMIFSRVVDPTLLEEAVRTLQETAPQSLGSLLANQIQAASKATAGELTWGLALSLITFIWTVSTGIYTFQRAVRIAYGLDPQHYVRARALAYAFSLATIVILGILLLAAGAGAAWATTLGEPWRAIAFSVGITVALILGTATLVILFRVAGDGHAPRLNWPGALFGAVGSFAVFIGFGIYLRFATSYQAIYGTLASTVILSLVLYVATYVILIGAIGNAQWARQSASGPSPPDQDERSRTSNSPA